MKFPIQELQKKPEGLSFETRLDVTSDLKARNQEVLDLSPVLVTGHVSLQSGLYMLDYRMQYEITLASSRSLEPVRLSQEQEVQEIFVEHETALKEQELVDEELVLVLEGEDIDLVESVSDNILLQIPMKVLTPEEEAGAGLLAGGGWNILTEEDYLEEKESQKEANSPFAQLQGLFDQD